MRRSALMDVHLQLRPPPHHRPSGRRMIQVDMSQQNSPRLLTPNRVKHSLERGLRPRINERPIYLPTTNDMGAPQVHNVNNPHPAHPTGVGGGVTGPSPLLPADPSSDSPYAKGAGKRSSASNVCRKPSSIPRGEYPSSRWAFS